MEGTSGVLSDIPEEILEYIILFLSPYRDFKNTKLVSKQWYRITTGVVTKLKKDLLKAVETASTEWIKLPSDVKHSITERYSHSAVYCNKFLYVFGGCTSTNTTFNDLWQYDLAHRVWNRTLGSGSYPSPKACASMVLYRNKLVLFGGWSHPTPYPLHQAARFYNQLHIYDTHTSVWRHQVCENSPQGKAGHSAVVIRDIMIIFGGSHGHGFSSNELWVLDFENMVWRQEETEGIKPSPRYGQSFIVINDQNILLMGGCGGPNKQFSDLWLLDLSTTPWRWKEVFAEGQEYAPQQLWCHAACLVGETIVVLSKATKPPVLPIVEPECTKAPLLTTKLAQARRAMPDTSESSSQDSSSDTDDVAQRNCRTVRMRNANKSPHHRQPARVHCSTSSSSETLLPVTNTKTHAAAAVSTAMDTQPSTSTGHQTNYDKQQLQISGTLEQKSQIQQNSHQQQNVSALTDNDISAQSPHHQPMEIDTTECANCKSQHDVCTCEGGFCPATSSTRTTTAPPTVNHQSSIESLTSSCSANVSSISNQASQSTLPSSSQEPIGERVLPFKVPFKSSFKGAPMPSVRPNATKNRQKQLETLRMYEEKFKAKMAAAGVDSKDVRIQGHNVEVIQPAKKRVQNPMYIHTLDIKSLVSNGQLSWNPLKQNIGEAPEETIFYSLDCGWGELIMFGGIQADLGSMQRTTRVDSQVVSKHVYVIKPKSTGVS